MTYADNGRIVGDGRRLVLLDPWAFFDPQVFHIAASKDNVFVDLVCWGDLLLGLPLPPLGAIRNDIFERNGRFLRVDLVEHTRVASRLLVHQWCLGVKIGRQLYRMSLLDMSEMRALGDDEKER